MVFHKFFAFVPAGSHLPSLSDSVFLPSSMWKVLSVAMNFQRCAVCASDCEVSSHLWDFYWYCSLPTVFKCGVWIEEVDLSCQVICGWVELKMTLMNHKSVSGLFCGTQECKWRGYERWLLLSPKATTLYGQNGKCLRTLKLCWQLDLWTVLSIQSLT